MSQHICIICGNKFYSTHFPIYCCSQECSKTNRKNTLKQYREANKEVQKVYQQQYRTTHKKTIAKPQKLIKIKLPKPPKSIKVQKAPYEYERNKKAIDPNYKLMKNFRSGISKAIKKNYGKKAYHTTELLGCSVEEVRKHLESLWTEGMSWDNHGQYGWHIDHKIPIDSFNLANPEEQKRCFHYTNLQPLWWRDNIVKRNKIL